MKNKIAFSLALSLSVFGLSQLDFAQAQSKSSQPKSRAVTFTGMVSGSPQNGEFYLRVGGQNWRIKAASKAQLSKVMGGDQVRAYGRPLGNIVYNAQIRVLRPKASTNPDDYLPRR